MRNLAPYTVTKLSTKAVPAPRYITTPAGPRTDNLACTLHGTIATVPTNSPALVKALARLHSRAHHQGGDQ